MNAGLAWMLAGIVLCGAELVLPGAFLLWLGLAAIGAGVLTYVFGLAITAGVAAFVVCLGILLLIPLLRGRKAGAQAGGVNSADHDLIGKTCYALAFDGPEGRVSFRDGTWKAVMADGASPISGGTLRIVGLSGTTLRVEKTPSAEKTVA